jgi:hypothetical protein
MQSYSNYLNFSNYLNIVSKRLFRWFIRNCKFILVIVFFILLGGVSNSCGKKVYPSGIEIDFKGSERTFQRKIAKRERVAKRFNRRKARLERRANRPIEKKKREEATVQKKAIEKHIKMQHPDVQKRMLENRKFAENRYRKKRSVKEILVFWKKKKYKCHGS